MLFSFSRYTTNLIFSKILKKSNITHVIVYSSFYRKNYFRSLLSCLNFHNANFLSPCGLNFFYVWRFVSTYFNGSHPNFYYKKLIVK